MAVTFTPTLRKVFSIGDRKMVLATVACTGSATAGGDVLAAADLGLELELDSVLCGAAAKADGSQALVAQWDASDGKVTFYVQGTAGAGTPMDDYTGATANFSFEVVAVGKGSAA